MSTPSNWRPATTAAVCRAIGCAGVPEGDFAPTLGDIALHDHQVTAVSRLQQSIATFGGALLADTVGLGKTYAALALAQAYDRVDVVAPATLLPMWRRAMHDARCTNTVLHSLHQLSRRRLAVPRGQRSSLLIVDEAHHLRTRNTIRYRNAALLAAGRNVLLLTATPVHNRPGELRNLLALFLGDRADALDDSSIAQCVVRRTSTSHTAGRMPAVLEHQPFRISSNMPVLDCLLSVPAPLPAKLGSAAGALIRLGLLHAWCSSDAALTSSLRRRQVRGEAMLHALANGRYPTQRELQTFVSGSDSIQLGFAELLVQSVAEDSGALLKTVAAHLDGLQRLLQLHTRTATADAERVSRLRSMLAPSHQQMMRGERPTAPPIIAFSHFASTISALHRALRDIAGVAAVTGHGGHIASGKVPRNEVIQQFAPRAHGRPPPPVHEHIQLLLTTDILSEGVNLQDAAVVIHLDLPWTDAARQQRVGRAARLGSQHDVVHVYTFAPPAGIDRTLRIVETLRRKAGLARMLVGRESTFTTATPANSVFTTESPAEQATRLQHLLADWRVGRDVRAEDTSRDMLENSEGFAAKHHNAPSEGGSHHELGTLPVAAVSARVRGFIAAVDTDSRAFVVAGFGVTDIGLTDSVVNSSTATVLRAVDAIYHPARAQQPTSASVALALQQLAQWRHTRELRALAGPTARGMSAAHRRAMQLIALRISTVPAALRPALGELAHRAEQHVLQARGAGQETMLIRWCAEAHTTSVVEWLASAAQLDVGDTAGIASLSHDSWRVRALLLLESSAE